MLSRGDLTGTTGKLSILVVLLGLSVPVAWSQQTIFVSPDVPATPDGVDYLPWQVVRHTGGGPPYSLELTVPGNPAVDALHKMDRPGNWLFSIESVNDLAGSLGPGVFAEPRDIVRWDVGAGAFSLFFCGGSVTDPVSLGTNLDAAYLDGGDSGDLVVSFDVPVEIPAGSGVFHDPADLLRYERLLPGCGGWAFLGVEYDASASGVVSPSAANVIGADRAGGKFLLALDIPADLSPTLGPVTYTPGQIVSWDLSDYDLFEDLQVSGIPGWPITGLVDAVTCQANPGRIDASAAQITMSKNLPDISITCPASCSSGAESYGIYEGVLPVFYTHVGKSGFCAQTCPGTTVFTAPVGDTYYLLVPNNNKEEGSYGLDLMAGVSSERPQAAGPPDRCVIDQTITSCP